ISKEDKGVSNAKGTLGLGAKEVILDDIGGRPIAVVGVALETTQGDEVAIGDTMVEGDGAID
ncbi:hypothetical protein KI387_025071, partial [Taxus chinensis]